MKKEWRWLVGFIIPPSCTIRICNPKLKKSTLKTGYATGLKIQRIQELGLQLLPLVMTVGSQWRCETL